MHGSAANPKYDIVDTAKSEASFELFLNALKAVDPMVDYLKGAGPFTVFMPTDQAFESLPAGTVEELEKPANMDQLKRLIQYHIVKGRHLSSEVKTMQTMETVKGEKLAIESGGHGIRVNNAMVLGTEILCTNGVIHAIDSLLALP